MSNSKLISKIETRMIIGFDDQTKAEIAGLKDKLDAVANALNEYKPTGGLLAVMAANDAQPELKQMGQWVFEGQPDHIKSAAVNMDGRAFYYRYKKSELVQGTMGPYFIDNCCDFNQIDGVFDANDWQNSAINRETVNDVDYLSDNDLDESVSHIDDVLALPNWLSGYAGLQITQSDMQLIFIKNLSNVLIQRMHSMNRFSHEDYTIGGRGGDKLEPWDIVYDIGSNQFGLVSGYSLDKSEYSSFFFGAFNQHTRLASSFYMTNDELRTSKIRTITESQIKDFNSALEVFYG